MTNQSKLTTLATAVLAIAGVANAGYQPQCFDSNYVFASTMPDKWGVHHSVQRVSTKESDSGMQSRISTCYAADTGEQQPADVCISDITRAMVACAFSSIAYHGGMQQTKRGDQTAKFVEALGSGVQVHAVFEKDNDVTSKAAPAAMSAKSAGPTYTLAKEDFDSSLPITALVSPKGSKAMPFLLQSDGETVSIGQTSVASKKTKRDGDPSQITGWELRQNGAGIKIQSNSDPVANYDEVVEWLDSHDDQFGTVLGGFIEATKGEWVGGSLHNSKADNFYNGQWLAVVKHEAFDMNWETGWNWCYGVYKTNCDPDADCPLKLRR